VEGRQERRPAVWVRCLRCGALAAPVEGAAGQDDGFHPDSCCLRFRAEPSLRSHRNMTPRELLLYRKVGDAETVKGFMPVTYTIQLIFTGWCRIEFGFEFVHGCFFGVN
jgi:hypothetical protein